MRRSAMAAVVGASASPRPCPCRPRRAGRPSCRPRPAARSGRTPPPPCPRGTGKSARSASASSSARFTRMPRQRVVFALQGARAPSPAASPRPRSRGRLAKLVVHRGQDRALQRLARHLEARRLAGQLRRAVLGREGHVDGTGLARPDAVELLGEAGDEALARRPRSACRWRCRPGTARPRPRRPRPPAGPRSRTPPSRPCSAGRSSVMSSSLRLRWAIEASVFSICSSPGSAFSRSSSMPAKSGIGISGITSISTLNSRSVPSAKFTSSIFGCSAGRRPRSDDHLLGRLVHRLLQHLAHHRLAVALLHHPRRHLAGPEAGQAELLAELGQALLALGGDVGRGDHHRKGPLQPLVRDLGHLHRFASIPIPRRATRRPGRAVVRAEGFEPPRLAPPEPKSGVSANSTTPAS